MSDFYANPDGNLVHLDTIANNRDSIDIIETLANGTVQEMVDLIASCEYPVFSVADQSEISFHDPPETATEMGQNPAQSNVALEIEASTSESFNVQASAVANTMCTNTSTVPLKRSPGRPSLDCDLEFPKHISNWASYSKKERKTTINNLLSVRTRKRAATRDGKISEYELQCYETVFKRWMMKLRKHGKEVKSSEKLK